jgi:hypothetical protein
MARLNIETLSGLRNCVLPSVWAMQERAERDGIPIYRADVEQSFEHDGLMLNVQFRLLERYDVVGRADWKPEVAHRISSAFRLFHRTTQAKALCVDRRRLMIRGERARKAKVRRK